MTNDLAAPFVDTYVKLCVRQPATLSSTAALVIALAGPAIAPVVEASRIRLIVRMALRTVRLRGQVRPTIRVTAPQILSTRSEFQVGRVYAKPMTATDSASAAGISVVACVVVDETFLPRERCRD